MRLLSSTPVFTALVLGLALGACGGRRTTAGDLGGQDAGDVTGKACAFDTDCNPPDYVCDSVSLTCVQGCGLNPNCPPGKECNLATGRCVIGVDGHPDAGHDGGTTNDPTVPSDNPNGCGFCGQCSVNNDCVTGSVCGNGSCATGPCTGWLDCALGGAYLARCTDVGLPQKYCLPILGQCIALP